MTSCESAAASGWRASAAAGPGGPLLGRRLGVRLSADHRPDGPPGPSAESRVSFVELNIYGAAKPRKKVERDGFCRRNIIERDERPEATCGGERRVRQPGRSVRRAGACW